MNTATRSTVSIFGVVVAMAGLEHGIGEVWQGNVAPDGVVFESWAGSPWFDILAGEPAMSLVPNLLASGILTILVSLVLLAWVTLFIHRQHGGPVLIGLSLLLLLVGGGFGPPLVGFILGAVATRINAPLTWWRDHLPPGARSALSRLWPWLLGLGVAAWLFMFPGTILLDATASIKNPELTVYTAGFAAFALLLLAIVAAFARDIQTSRVPTP